MPDLAIEDDRGAALTLANALNSFTGTVAINEGNLNVASDGALGTEAPLEEPRDVPERRSGLGKRP